MDESRGGLQERPRREPLFNAPWTILVLCLGLIAIYIWERWVGSEALIATYGLSRLTLRLGRWDTLVTCLFLHASWAHVLMNSVAAFAFGPPVARLMGTGPRGAIVFFAFYLVCGVVGGLGLVMMDSRATVVGASGAISGFVGAAIRMLDGEGRVGPLLKRNVVIFTLVWGVGNYVLGAFGLTPGAIGIPVAWQAHLFGYLGGLLLVGVFARLAGRSDAAFTH